MMVLVVHGIVLYSLVKRDFQKDGFGAHQVNYGTSGHHNTLGHAGNAVTERPMNRRP